MTYHNENLAALIGSRICHDLISPVGAINNGLELLALSGAPGGSEMNLVSDSAANANARIRLFRLAFGVTSDTQGTRHDEITSIWSGVHSEGRISLIWHGPEILPRPEAQLVVLACLCAEVALPMGGTLRIDQVADTWRISASGSKLAIDQNLWSNLKGQRETPDVQPAHVQFLLLPDHLAKMGRQCTYAETDNTLCITF